jgi:hypothetical protein
MLTTPLDPTKPHPHSYRCILQAPNSSPRSFPRSNLQAPSCFPRSFYRFLGANSQQLPGDSKSPSLVRTLQITLRIISLLIGFYIQVYNAKMIVQRTFNPASAHSLPVLVRVAHLVGRPSKTGPSHTSPPQVAIPATS